mmetsp:Transcript_17111/g.23945  ORF Transcript_17111/g.23945 Transcript_17111/m.23945 type:complete len:129 (-) Transcript_17111:427-813(-)
MHHSTWKNTPLDERSIGAISSEHGKEDTNDVWGINEHAEWTRKRNHALMDRVSRQRRWDLTVAVQNRCKERIDEVNERRPVQKSRNHEEMKLETGVPLLLHISTLCVLDHNVKNKCYIAICTYEKHVS